MGLNTVVLIRNDAFPDIRDDPEFGYHLERVASRMLDVDEFLDVSSGSYINAATVLETHHADTTCLIAAGDNTATVLLYADVGACRTEESQIVLLRCWADKLGYSLTKKRKRRV